jgi:hypothetical protein
MATEASTAPELETDVTKLLWTFDSRKPPVNGSAIMAWPCACANVVSASVCRESAFKVPSGCVKYNVVGESGESRIPARGLLPPVFEITVRVFVVAFRRIMPR